jgi:hypothetical protein
MSGGKLWTDPILFSMKLRMDMICKGRIRKYVSKGTP